MKKILLILSVICVLFLVGCNSNENVIVDSDNNIQEDVGNQTQENEEQKQDENKENENLNEQIVQTDEEKYKLSDSYYISGEELAGETLIELSYNSTKYDAHSYVQSDGVEFDITCELKDVGMNERGMYDIRINGEIIELAKRY